MKYIYTTLLFLLVTSQINYSQTTISGGNVYGLWEKSKSPYIINETITIPYGETLEIEPGVTVTFSGHYKLNVQGCIKAIGNKNDRIAFTTTDTGLVWHGVRFHDTPPENDTSEFEYCLLENGNADSKNPDYMTDDDFGGAIFIHLYDKVKISNSIIRNNLATRGGGIYCGNGALEITNSIISNNEAIYSGGGIYIEQSEIHSTGNIISDNTSEYNAAIYTGNVEAYFINNTIVNNYSENSNPVIDLNTSSSKRIEMKNSIVYYNAPNIIAISSGRSITDFSYCNIQNGYDAVMVYNPPFVGEFSNVIKAEPVFLYPDTGNYNLGASPCINAGDPNTNVTYYGYDIDDNPRIFNEPNARIDIGAYEYQGLFPNRAPSILDKREFHLLQDLTSEIKVYYYDADEEDDLSFEITTGDTNVTMEITDVNDTYFLTQINPRDGWEGGELYMYIQINDNAGAENSICQDSLKLIISNEFKGIINSKTVFKDTVKVIGDITVTEEGALDILPDTYIEFQDYYKIEVYGGFNCYGKEDSMIVFNALDDSIVNIYGNDYEKGWAGIEFINLNGPDTVFIENTVIKNTGIESSERKISNGTITILDSKNLYFRNCEFYDNFTCLSNTNCGIYAENTENIVIKNCEFSDGYSSDIATYIRTDNSEIFIDSCKFFNTYSRPDYNDNCIWTFKSHTSIKNSEFFNNYGWFLLRTSDLSFVLENCDLINNTSDGIFVATDGAIIRNNRIIGNRKAIECRTNTKIINNLIAFNTFLCNCSNFIGGGIDIDGAGSTLVANNTIVHNFQDSNGSVVYSSYSSPYITNNVFWNNNREGVSGYNGADIGIDPPVVIRNIIQGTSRWPESYDVDPAFRLNDTCDFSITNTSPCINHGLKNTTNLFLPEYDLNGNLRIDTFSNIVDIGAYEYNGKDVIVYPLSVDKIEANIPQGKLDVYPNPVSHLLFIAEKYNNKEYEIFSLDGKIIRSGIVKNGAINVEYLNNNIYILVVKVKEQNIYKTFIKR